MPRPLLYRLGDKEFKAEDVQGIQINKQLLDIERFALFFSTDGVSLPKLILKNMVLAR